MKGERDWKHFCEAKAKISDFEFDRGAASCDEEIERFSNEELLEFIAARPNDTVFDAGCGRTLSGLTQGLMQVVIGSGKTSSRFQADSLPLGI